MAKNRNNTKEYARIATIFGSRTNYEMFCVYWAYLCKKLNPNTVNQGKPHRSDMLIPWLYFLWPRIFPAALLLGHGT